MLRPVRRAWLLIIFGPTALFALASLMLLFVMPYPVPKNATRAQRLYLTHCATCHGSDGRGSWRATLLFMRPGDLADPRTLASMDDPYLLELIKNGGATLGRPGMPAFGYHLSDAEIRELIGYLREVPARTRRRNGS
jgi:mono/diheme cytochrome c family protein